MELPKKPIPAITPNPKKLILYGPPKVGKTEFCSRLADNLIIDLEEGTDHVECLKVKVKTFDEFTELAGEIIKAGKPYKYITLDTITALEDWCDKDATIEYMNSIVGKAFNRYESGSKAGQLKPVSEWQSVLTLPNGAGYLWLRMSFKKWIDRAVTLAPNLIMLAHLKDKFLEKKGTEVSAKDLDLTGKIKAIVSAGADAIGYIYREGDKGENLRISFQSSDTVLCGARPEHLRGVDIEADWSKIFI